MIKEKLDSKLQAMNWNRRLSSTEYRQRRMVFGKYINVKIEDLPMAYLKWAILNFEKGQLLDFLIRELQHRDSKFK